MISSSSSLSLGCTCLPACTCCVRCFVILDTLPTVLSVRAAKIVALHVIHILATIHWVKPNKSFLQGDQQTFLHLLFYSCTARDRILHFGASSGGRQHKASPYFPPADVLRGYVADQTVLCVPGAAVVQVQIAGTGCHSALFKFLSAASFAKFNQSTSRCSESFAARHHRAHKKQWWLWIAMPRRT